MLYILCKMISEIFDVKDMTGSFTLIFPIFTIGVKDTITKQISERRMEFWTFDIILKVIYL
jgi:tRNA splicing ligase